MPQDILAIAVIRPEPGKQEETLAVLHDLYVVMARKGYSRNRLFRDVKDPVRLVNVRYWSSEDAPRNAQEDPDVQRVWERLGRVAQVDRVLQMEEIPDTWTPQ
jgi:quinol monooxygenase YgiN